MTTCIAPWLGLRSLLFCSLMLAAAKGAEPLVSVSVNGRGAATVFPGMPLLISGTFVSSEPFDCAAPEVVLTAGEGPWAGAVKLTIRNSNGVLQAWPMSSVITLSNSIALDCSRYGRLDWWLTPDQTSILATGVYTMELALDTRAFADSLGWKGSIIAVPAQLDVRAEPDALSEADAENKYGQLAEYDVFISQPVDALITIDLLLGLYPTNITGLRMRAETLERLGRIAEALAVCDQALADLDRMYPGALEPPRNLLTLRRRLEIQLQPTMLSMRLEGGLLRLEWASVPGLIYAVQASGDLRTWSDFAAGLEATDLQYMFQTNVSRGVQFFRLVR